MSTDPEWVAGYADELRAIVREWRHGTWRRLPAAQRKLVAQPSGSAPVSDDLVRCAWLLCHAYGGAHHVGRVKVDEGGRFLVVTHYGGAATADGSVLTRLVVGAHEAAVRVEVQGGGPRGLRILLHPRARTSSNMTNHPTIENAVAVLRDRWAACPVPVPIRDEEKP